MSITLQELADLVHGKVLGDPKLVIHAARSLQEAGAGDITFVDHEKRLPQLKACNASAAVAPPSVPLNGKALIQVADPLSAFVAIVQHLHGKAPAKPCGIDDRACVHPTAKLGSNVSVYPFAYVGENAVIGDRCTLGPGAVVGRDCKLGDDVTIHANAVLYDGTQVEDRSIVHANTVLGADGFGYRLHEGRHVKVPQLGCVIVGKDVEIGACAAIDRGTFQATRIGDGTKIDNLVQIGHNCQIGRHNILVSQVGIAGSCSTDEYVVMAGQVGVADHVHIGAGAMIGAKAGVAKDVPSGERMFGVPATPEWNQKRALLSLERLPEMRRDLKKVKHHLGMGNDE